MAVLLRGPGSSYLSNNAIAGRLDWVAWSRKCHRWGLSTSLQPSKYGMPIWMNDRHHHLGKQNLAAKVGKGAQANEGMGEGRHHMALHCCRGKRWGRGKSCAGNRLLREAVGYPNLYSRSSRVQIGNWDARHKIESTGARVGNASVGRRKLGGIVSASSG
jgi:hypothetical protein